MPRRGIGTTWLAAVGTWMSAIHFGLRPLRHSLGTSDGVPAECSQYGRSWWTTASPYRGLPAYLGPLCATGNCRCCRPRIDGGCVPHHKAIDRHVPTGRSRCCCKLPRRHGRDGGHSNQRRAARRTTTQTGGGSLVLRCKTERPTQFLNGRQHGGGAGAAHNRCSPACAGSSDAARTACRGAKAGPASTGADPKRVTGANGSA